MMTKLRGLAVPVLFWILFACASPVAHAEFAPAKSDSIESSILKQKRALDVYLPADASKNPERRYETIYVLDGDWNTKIVVQTVEFLQSVGFMPPVIVVSVPNFFDDKKVNSRDHDLTPSVVDHEPRSGGAAQFLAFLKTELVPYVNQHYPANGVNLVHGHSYGGLFLNYVIATDPNVFDGYVILDPAMWWDDFRISKELDEAIASTPTQGKAMYIAGRSGPAFKGMGVDTLQPVFEKSAPKNLQWKIVAYPNETHDSLKFKATFDALKFMYRGYSDRGIDIEPTDGIMLKGKPLTLFADTDRFDYFYTTDGTEPTVLSQKMDRRLEVNDPSTFRIKEISARGHDDKEVALHFRFGEALAPARSGQVPKPVEFRFAYYAADAWPSFRGRAFEHGTTTHIDTAHVSREHFAGVVERDYEIPADGYYALVLGSSDKARVYMAGKKFLDITGTEQQGPRAFVVPLRAGVYPVRLEFLKTAKDHQLEFHLFRYQDDDKGWWHDMQ